MEVKNSKLKAWIEEMQILCKPTQVHVCDGSHEESIRLCHELVSKKAFVPLARKPGSYWCRSNPEDVARVKESTFICKKETVRFRDRSGFRNPNNAGI